MSLISDELLTNVTDEQNSDSARLATVVESADGKCVLQFYGESEPSNLSYYVLNGIALNSGDTVVVMHVGSSLVVCGTIKKEAKTAYSAVERYSYRATRNFSNGLNRMDIPFTAPEGQIIGIVSMKIGDSLETSNAKTDVTILGHVYTGSQMRIFYNNTSGSSKNYYLTIDAMCIK